MPVRIKERFSLKLGFFKRSTSKRAVPLLEMLLFALLISALRLKSFSSMEINCSATSTHDGTFYNVPDFGDHRCDFYWINSSNQTVAHTDEKMDDLVVASNITSLQTHKCYERMEYVLDCYPKLKKTTRCVTNCSQIAGVSRKPGNPVPVDWAYYPVGK
ncbi:hypothetical protein CRENBAI_014140 [Crenichthys baileyi]|uniref:Uncharacterized protein n=1 Tax=Crenichthys baileyi TaxID=28760 RepID=A0AAV9R8H3_9TELE